MNLIFLSADLDLHILHFMLEKDKAGIIRYTPPVICNKIKKIYMYSLMYDLLYGTC